MSMLSLFTLFRIHLVKPNSALCGYSLAKNFWERYQAKIFSLPPFLGSPFIVDRISGAFPLPSFTFDICLGIS